MEETNQLIDIAHYYTPSIMLAVGWCGVAQIARGNVFGVMLGVVLAAIGGTGILLWLHQAIRGSLRI